MKRRALLMLGLFLGMYGCACGTVLLKSERGGTVECRASEGPVDACVKRYEAEGYRRSEGRQESPTPTPSAGY